MKCGQFLGKTILQKSVPDVVKEYTKFHHQVSFQNIHRGMICTGKLSSYYKMDFYIAHGNRLILYIYDEGNTYHPS